MPNIAKRRSIEPKICSLCNISRPANYYDNDNNIHTPYKVCKTCRERVSRKKECIRLYRLKKEEIKQERLIEQGINTLYYRMRRQTQSKRNYIALLKTQLVRLTSYPIKYNKKLVTIARNEADLQRWYKAYELQAHQLRTTGRHEHLIDCYNQQS